MSGYVPGVVAERTQWAPGLVTLRVEAAVAPHRAGQFRNLALEVGGERVKRAYSMASAPGAPLELLLNRVADGVLSPVLTELPVGASLWVDPTPQGFFTLDYVPRARDLWLVATGTGLAPFVALWREGELWRRFERVVVVHGVRTAAELAYRDELSALVQARPGQLSQVSITSREDVSGLLHGRVTTALVDGSLERRAGVCLDPAYSHVLLCGNPAMIDELSTLLAARDLVKHRVRRPGHVSFEKYW